MQLIFYTLLKDIYLAFGDAKTDGHADWIIRLASSRPIMYSSEASSRNNIAVRLDDEAAVYNYFLSRMYSEGVSLKRSRKSVLK